MMKRRATTFLSGMLAAVVLMGLGITAFAVATGRQITVYPITIHVNGQDFYPEDVTGKQVDVFAYNGTTYAPLRALAEAYGLEVEYDSVNNVANVIIPGSNEEDQTVSENGTVPTLPSGSSISSFQRVDCDAIIVNGKRYDIDDNEVSIPFFEAKSDDKKVIMMFGLIANEDGEIYGSQSDATCALIGLLENKNSQVSKVTSNIIQNFKNKIQVDIGKTTIDNNYNKFTEICFSYGGYKYYNSNPNNTVYHIDNNVGRYGSWVVVSDVLNTLGFDVHNVYIKTIGSDICLVVE